MVPHGTHGGIPDETSREILEGSLLMDFLEEFLTDILEELSIAVLEKFPMET